MFQQPVNRVSHVAFCVKPENFERVVSFWENAYGLKFDDIDVPRLGIRVKVDIEAGLEILTPDPSIGPVADRITEFLESGEGVYTVVFGIDDMDAALAQAEANGIQKTHRQIFDPSEGAKTPKGVASIEESHLELFMGTRVTLGRLLPEATG